MIGDFGSGPTQIFTFYCGKPEVDLGEILVGAGRPSAGSSIPENMEKIGRELGRYEGHKLGFQI